MLERLIGKRLQRLSVYEPWKTAGSNGDDLPPLFGAIAFEFDDLALICKSGLRFYGTGESCREPGDPGGIQSFGFHMELCRRDELPILQSAIVWRSPGQRVLPRERDWCSLHRDVTDEDNAYPDLREVLGCRVQSVEIHRVNAPTPHRQAWYALAITFAESGKTLQISYREDLDGALQVAAPDWTYEIQQIVFNREHEAFGWLSPRAPYAITTDCRCWPNLEKYLQVFTSPQKCQDQRWGPKWDKEAWFEHGMRLKLEQHPGLMRRFLAIQYPIRGAHLDDGTNIALQSLLLQYKIWERREIAMQDAVCGADMIKTNGKTLS